MTMATMHQTMIEEMAAVGWNSDENRASGAQAQLGAPQGAVANARVIEAELAITRAMERAQMCTRLSGSHSTSTATSCRECRQTLQTEQVDAAIRSAVKPNG